MKLYEVEIGGVKHVLQYEDKDAPKGAKVVTKAAVAKEAQAKAARAPQNKGA